NAADDRTGGKRQARNRRPDAKRLGPAGGVRKGLRNDRQGRRQQCRSADAEQRPEADQPADGWRNGAEDRSQHKQDNPAQENTGCPQSIGQRTHAQQHAGKYHRIRARYPAHSAESAAQRIPDGRKCDRDDRRVQKHDEVAEGQPCKQPG
ncbi:hypothetical protein BGX30_007020, partial [Mortierella sp. GBA39]